MTRPLPRTGSLPRKQPAPPTREEGGRARITRAAARLFREKGFQATTVRELAEAAGMQSGSLFYFFPSKNGILLAVMDEGMAEVHAAVAMARQDADPAEGFRAMLRCHLEGILDRDSDHMTVMLYESRGLPPEAGQHVRHLRRDYEALWEAQIGDLIRAGRWRHPAEPRLSRLALMGALNWSVQWFRPHRGDSIERLVGTLCAIFLEDPR